MASFLPSAFVMFCVSVFSSVVYDFNATVSKLKTKAKKQNEQTNKQKGTFQIIDFQVCTANSHTGSYSLA